MVNIRRWILLCARLEMSFISRTGYENECFREPVDMSVIKDIMKRENAQGVNLKTAHS